MKKRLKATAQRTPRRDFIDDDVYEEEPNMRLSRAFFVVLILHVVAVGGIFAFNKIQLGHEKPATGTSEIAIVDSAPSITPVAGERHHFLRSGEKLIDVAAKYNVSVTELQTVNGLKSLSDGQVGQRLLIPDKGTTPTTAPSTPGIHNPEIQRLVSAAPVHPHSSVNTAAVPAASGESYTVVKGDNPVAIARQHGVDYNELIQLNGITDPLLLQIGQVLKIPKKKQ